MDKLYDKKDNIQAAMALEAWAMSQELTPCNLLYASLRLVAAQFVLHQASDNVSPDKMVADMELMQTNMGFIFRTMVKEIIQDVVKATSK